MHNTILNQSQYQGMTIQQVINVLESIPKDQRNLHLFLFNYASGEHEPIVEISPYNDEQTVSPNNPLSISYNSDNDFDNNETENCLPFDISNLVASKVWKKTSKSERQRFIKIALLYDSLINYYSDKYHAKKTLKGTFIADVLMDWYYDFFDKGLNYPDEEITRWYDDLNGFTDELIVYCDNSKQWIKTLKKEYKDYKKVIYDCCYNAKTKTIDLDWVSDISEEYRDVLYEVLPVSN